MRVHVFGGRRDHQAAEPRPPHGAEALHTWLGGCDKLVFALPVQRQVMHAQLLLSQQDRQHFRMSDARARGQNAVDARRDQLAGSGVEDRGGERPSLMTRVQFGQLQSQPHPLFRGRQGGTSGERSTTCRGRAMACVLEGMLMRGDYATSSMAQ